MVLKQTSLSTQLEKMKQSVIIDIKVDLFVPNRQSLSRSVCFNEMLILCLRTASNRSSDNSGKTFLFTGSFFSVPQIVASGKIGSH